MGFNFIKTFDFRNLEDQTVELVNREIILTGENGQGKSNFLEAVYLLSYGSSFRTRQENLLIKHGRKEMTVFGEYSGAADDISQSVAVNISAKTKKITFNGKAVRDRKDLIQNIPCIIFSHEDISFVNGPPERQRWFFDQTMSMYDPDFINNLRNYRKILKLRNIELKNGRRQLLDIYDRQLAEVGLELQKTRDITVQEFNQTFSPLFRDISGLDDELHIRYVPSWKDCSTIEDIVVLLNNKRENDLILGTSTNGPHRDNYRYYRAGKNFARIASTGQLRLISLILRVAQSKFYSLKSSRMPILLLDDVLLELDRGKREKFMEYLPGYEQVFFTFLPGEQYSGYKMSDMAVYEVNNGAVKKV